MKSKNNKLELAKEEIRKDKDKRVKASAEGIEKVLKENNCSTSFQIEVLIAGSKVIIDSRNVAQDKVKFQVFALD